MKIQAFVPLGALTGLFLLIASLNLPAQVPQLLHYQGRAIVSNTNFEGSGQFKFALVNGAGTVTYWSNDGSSTTGNEPSAGVALVVTKGLYAVLLGDTALPNMTAVPTSVFANTDVRLRVWFNGGPGFQLVAPDQRIAAVGYALKAATVDDGAITAAQLAPNAVAAASVVDGTLTAAKLASGEVVKSLNGLKDAVTLSAGANITLSTVGNSVQITAPNTGGWGLSGNSGTTTASFLGTTDNQPLELKVNNARGLRIEPSDFPGIVNLIGGSAANSILPGTIGSVIAGGGIPDSVFGGAHSNTVAGRFSFLGCGTDNSIEPGANYSFLGGGIMNSIQTNVSYCVLGGGLYNSIQADANRSFLGGGENNYIQLYAHHSFLGGGSQNSIKMLADHSFLGGGRDNSIQTNASNSVLGGGVGNSIGTGASASFLGGGNGNSVGTDSYYAAIGGGFFNRCDSSYVTICGGNNNAIESLAPYSAICGGYDNSIRSQRSAVLGGAFNRIGTNSPNSAILGGESNEVNDNARYGTVVGGYGNSATNYSLAAGYGATAVHNGAFVWADYAGAYVFSSAATNEFAVRARGGVRFVTAMDGSGNPTKGATLASGGESWGTISDRNAKKNFQAVDAKEVLAKLSQVPVQHWNYKCEDDQSTPHLGPVAQDFKAAFFPGRDDKVITTLEFDGVELAAIQGLNQLVQEKDAELARLRQEVAAQQQQNHALDTRLSALEQALQGIRSTARSQP